MSEIPGEPVLKPPPSDGLRVRLEAFAAGLAASGQAEAAEALRADIARWLEDEHPYRERIANALSVHHEINNALVGVRGNAQLLLMNPAAQQPGVRERLEVILRESSRIQQAGRSLRELKASLGQSVSRADAA